MQMLPVAISFLNGMKKDWHTTASVQPGADQRGLDNKLSGHSPPGAAA